MDLGFLVIVLGGQQAVQARLVWTVLGVRSVSVHVTPGLMDAASNLV